MKLGIIGCGSIGARHWRNAKGLDVDTYVFEPEIATLDFDVHGTNVIEYFWDQHPTHVLIASPAETHEHYLRACVDRGLPVFVEKPLAMHWSTELEQLVSKAKLTSAVGFNWRCHPGVRAFKCQRYHKFVGPTMLVCHDDWDEWPGARPTNREPVLEVCHELDLLLWCYGESSWHMCEQHGSGYRVSDGVCGVDVNLKATERQRGVYCGGKYLAWADLAPPDYSINQMYRDELARFLEGNPVATLQDGLRVMKLIDRIREAGKVRQVTA